MLFPGEAGMTENSQGPCLHGAYIFFSGLCTSGIDPFMLQELTPLPPSSNLKDLKKTCLLFAHAKFAAGPRELARELVYHVKALCFKSI